MDKLLALPYEIRRWIPGFEGKYEISSISRIKGHSKYSKSKTKILKLYIGIYSQVTLYKDGKTYLQGFHRLMASAFIPNPENKPEVNHKNGIKTDNRLNNLEWVTSSENEIHAYRVLLKKPSNLGRFGKEHNTSKRILQKDLEGNVVGDFRGCYEASRKTGFCPKAISACCLLKHKSHKGYIREYFIN